MHGSVDIYDPHDYRNVRNPTTNWQAMANFLKASIDIGALAMPVAFQNAGYVNGLILSAILAIISVYCLHIMIGSMYLVCKRKRVPYVTLAEAMKIGFQDGPPSLKCFTSIATPFVDGFLAFYQFGTCCVFVVFIAESNKQIVDAYIVVWDKRIHMCLLLLPLLLIFSVRTLTILGYLSTFANVLLIVCFGFIMYYILIDLPPLSERKTVQSIERWPILFGIVLFSIMALGVFLSIEENMKTPKSFLAPCGVMNCSMVIIISLYIALGFFGYWKYGDEVLGSITLNIPQDEIVPQIIKIVYAFIILISYSLQGYVTIDIIWNKYLSKRVEDTSKHILYEMVMRIILVILSGLFLSVVGAFCVSVLGIICPALLQLCLQYNTGYGPFKLLFIKNIFLITFGIFFRAMGTFVGVVEILQTIYL